MKKNVNLLFCLLLVSVFLSGCGYREVPAAEPEAPAEEIYAEAPVAAVSAPAPAALSAVRVSEAEIVPALMAAEPVREPAVPRESAPAPDSP